MSYLHVNQRLKKEAVKLHTKFIKDCFGRLDEAAATPTETAQVGPAVPVHVRYKTQ